jgi:hypothetical protein
MGQGSVVYGFDGVRIGRIEQVNEEALVVARPDGTRWAVRKEAVFDVRPGEVRLICYASGIERWLAESHGAGEGEMRHA